MASEEVTTAATSAQRAFNNILVLKKIFQYSTSDCLYNFRLVSTRWNDVTSEILARRDHSILFDSTRKIEKFTQMATTGTSLAARNFSFRFNYGFFDDEENRVMEQFFEVCKDLIVELSLSVIWKMKDGSKRKSKFVLSPSVLLPRLENIQTFYFEVYHFISEKHIGDGVATWTETYLPSLLQGISNIRKLILRNRQYTSYDGVTTAFINNLCRLTSLTDLTIDCSILSDANIQSLCSLHLKSFHINVAQADFKTETFTQFLCSQTDSLEFIDIDEPYTNMHSQFTLEFPCMNALKSLFVSQAEKTPERLGIQPINISYPVMLPTVEKLIYVNLDRITDKWFLTPSHTLKELGLYCTHEPSIISEISQNFPALRKLEIVCSKECEYIFQYLTDLEELTLLCCDKFYTGDCRHNLDQLFTGYALDDLVSGEILSLDVIRMRKPYIGLLKSKLSVLRLLYRSNNVFNNLTTNITLELKVLRLHVSYDHPKLANVEVPTFTDFSVYHGFLDMDSLECFISVAEITKKCMEDLKKKCRVITANECDIESMEYLKHCNRESFLGMF